MSYSNKFISNSTSILSQTATVRSLKSCYGSAPYLREDYSSHIHHISGEAEERQNHTLGDIHIFAIVTGHKAVTLVALLKPVMGLASLHLNILLLRMNPKLLNPSCSGLPVTMNLRDSLGEASAHQFNVKTLSSTYLGYSNKIITWLLFLSYHPPVHLISMCYMLRHLLVI
jgi:hypothetical protein